MILPYHETQARLESLGKRVAELEDQVGVLVVVLIGTLTIMRSTATNSTRHTQISALLDVLAPNEEAADEVPA